MTDSAKQKISRRRSSKINRKPTVSDVAKHAGVSTATVSRCLSHSGVVKQALRTRVESSVKALGYVLDGTARALKTDRSKTIGVIVPTLEVGSFAAGLQALQSRLAEAGHSPLLAISGFDAKLEMQQAQNLVSHGVDGLVLIGMSDEHGLPDFLKNTGIPFVNTWTIGSDPTLPHIGFDNREGLRTITRYVLDKGHREIVLVVGGDRHANVRTLERKAGFKEALAQYDIKANEKHIHEVPYEIASGRLAFEKIWSANTHPTAIICGSDIIALGILQECFHRGISVPDDLSVTGFDGLAITTNLFLPMTGMHVPARAMGIAAADYVLAKLNDEPANPNQSFPCRLIEGKSVATIDR